MAFSHRKFSICKIQRFTFPAAVILFSVLLGTSCQYLTNVPASSPVVNLSAVTEEADLFDQVDGFGCVPNPHRYETATLIDVVDGDSIRIMLDGREIQVRYIGINTPEYDSSQREAAIAATRENRRLLSGSTLYLFKDLSNTDKYDRLLRYVVANGTFINLALVESGYAESKSYPPDTSCQTIFDQAVPD